MDDQRLEWREFQLDDLERRFGTRDVAAFVEPTRLAALFADPPAAAPRKTRSLPRPHGR